MDALSTMAAAAVATVAMIIVLRPLLQRYALAIPNARSSHRIPTPQGGGIAVIAATIAVSTAALLVGADVVEQRIAWILAAAAALAIVGVTDDIRPIEVLPRLLLQTLTILVIVVVLPAEFRIVPLLPWSIERLLLLFGGLWFVNLVNFMDGLDWMTVAEVVPITAGLALFGFMGALPHDATLVALALCGAMIGFAPFNRPVARLFLGDVGSLPIGFLLTWMLIVLAGRHLAAALLLPLYYLADATVTLIQRTVNGEPIIQAHRGHYYQRAADGGMSTYQIVGRVFAVNILLVGLAAITITTVSLPLHVAALAAGCATVGILLWNFGHKRR